MGVTAFSLEDALALLDDHGYDFHRLAKRIEVRRGITFQDIDSCHILPNSGPIFFRGIWYPCLNIGYSALNARAKRHARLYRQFNRSTDQIP